LKLSFCLISDSEKVLNGKKINPRTTMVPILKKWSTMAYVRASVLGMPNKVSPSTQKKCQFPINPGAVGIVIPNMIITIKTKAADRGRSISKAEKRTYMAEASITHINMDKKAKKSINFPWEMILNPSIR
jgi:hypothetical protein